MNFKEYGFCKISNGKMVLPDEFFKDFKLEGKEVRLCFHLDKIEIQIPTCIFCKSTNVVKHLEEKYICDECFYKIT